MMEIRFNDIAGNEIAAFTEVSSIPFKVGDIIEMNVANNNPEIWNVQEINFQKYKIISIKQLWSVSYPNEFHIDHIEEDIIITVEICEYEKEKED